MNPRVEAIAKKHGVPVADIQAQFKLGIDAEQEHVAGIALDHLTEIPDYYTRLQKMEKEAERVILKEYGVSEPVNTEPAKTKVSLLLGRFQPFHLGHKSLLEEMSYPAVIAVIRGKKSSQDKERNPFSFNTQKKAILAVAPEVLAVDEFVSADIAYIVDKFRDYGLEVVELWCGSDRVAGYKAQVDKYAPKINADITVKALTRNADADDVSSISATELRKALRDRDEKLVNKYMGKIKRDVLELLYSEIV